MWDLILSILEGVVLLILAGVFLVLAWKIIFEE